VCVCVSVNMHAIICMYTYMFTPVQSYSIHVYKHSHAYVFMYAYTLHKCTGAIAPDFLPTGLDDNFLKFLVGAHVYMCACECYKCMKNHTYILKHTHTITHSSTHSLRYCHVLPHHCELLASERPIQPEATQSDVSALVWYAPCACMYTCVC
jgi:hypothetical protein